MSTQTLTVNLPDNLYRQVVQHAERMHSSLEDELVAVVAAALSSTADVPIQTLDAMAQLAYLTDQELWTAAQMVVAPVDNERMQNLLWKRQAEGLTASEQAEAERLLQRSEHIMLVRAQAMALLRERGHDVTNLIQPPLPA